MERTARAAETAAQGFGQIIVTVVMDAEPVVGAKVLIFDARTGQRIRRLATNPQGQAFFGVPAPGEYSCSALLPREVGSPAVTAPSKPFRVTDGIAVQQALPHYRLRGNVVDERGMVLRGDRVAGITVSLEAVSSDGPGAADAPAATAEAAPEPTTGSFAFCVGNGTYQLLCLQQGHVVGQRQVTVRGAHLDGSVAIAPVAH